MNGLRDYISRMRVSSELMTDGEEWKKLTLCTAPQNRVVKNKSPSNLIIYLFFKFKKQISNSK